MEGTHDDIGGIGYIHQHGGGALYPARPFLRKGKKHHDKRNGDQDAGVDKEGGIGAHRADDAGQAKHKQNIEDVGADHVTHGDTRIALFGGHDGGDQFGQGGTDGHDGKADQRFAHAEGGGNRFGAIDHQLPTPDDGGGTGDAENNTLRPRKELLRRFFHTVLERTADKQEQIAHKEEQQDHRIKAAERPVKEHDTQSGGNAGSDRHVPFEHVAIGQDRQDDRRNTDDHQQIKDVRADDVAKGNAVVATERGRDTHGRFG